MAETLLLVAWVVACPLIADAILRLLLWLMDREVQDD